MHIKFVSIKLKNFLSYGNDETILNFQDSYGLSLIVATNGLGKSGLMLDSISFALYGKPYREIKISELINRTNKKNLYVSCTFIKNNDKYEICRGLQPDLLEIKKNDEKLDSFSSKKLNQIEIDKIIGLNHSLFKQIISLSVSNNKPFLSLDSGDKRKLIEQFFNIVVFGQMLKNNNKKISLIKIEQKINKNNYDNLSSNISSIKQNILKFLEIQKTFDQDKEKRIKDIENEIEIKKIVLNNLNEKISQYNNDIKEQKSDVDINDISRKIDEKSKDINNLEYENKKYNKDIKFLRENDICNVCNNTLTEEYKNIELDKLNSYIIINNNRLDGYNKDIIEYRNIKKKYDDEQRKFSEKFSNNQINIREKNQTEKDIKKLEETLHENEVKVFNIDIEEMKEDGKKKYAEYLTIKKKMEDDEIDIKVRENISELLSETGIKAYFFRKIVPILNVKINEYLKIFELPIRITFDEQLDYKIVEYRNVNYNISYMCYSEGEKKRIDIAILFSFISVAKVISNWDCNLLIIDELLDSAVDESGLEKMIECIKTMIYNKEISAFIISHRMNNMGSFKKVITIDKNYNGFSQIKEVI